MELYIILWDFKFIYKKIPNGNFHLCMGLRNQIEISDGMRTFQHFGPKKNNTLAGSKSKDYPLNTL